MKNIKELVTKFNFVKELKEKVMNGEICLPLSKIKDEQSEVAANIASVVNDECDATIVADAFGVGCDDPELAFIKAEALMIALDEGVALLNKRARVDALDTEIIADKVIISAYRGIKDVVKEEGIFSDEELTEAKTVVGQKFVEIASKFSESVRTYSSCCRHEAIDKMTISYVNYVSEIYNG